MSQLSTRSFGPSGDDFASVELNGEPNPHVRRTAQLDMTAVGNRVEMNVAGMTVASIAAASCQGDFSGSGVVADVKVSVGAGQYVDPQGGATQLTSEGTALNIDVKGVQTVALECGGAKSGLVLAVTMYAQAEQR